MATPDPAAESENPDSLDQFRHEVKTPLTVIRARAQLLARSIRRSPSLSDAERQRLLAGLDIIDAEVLAIVNTVDGRRREREGGPGA